MKKLLLSTLLCLSTLDAIAQNDYKKEGWEIQATNKENYNGVTLANGRIGIVSGKNIFGVSDIVLNGVFDLEYMGGVSRVVRGPLWTNLSLKIDNETLADSTISDWGQTLNMREAYLETNFDFQGKASVSYRTMALRNLPYMGLVVVDVVAKEDITLEAINQTLFPEELQNTNSQYRILRDLDVVMPLCTSIATSRTGLQDVASASAFLFDAEQLETLGGDDNKIISFTKELKKGERFRFALTGASTSSRDFVHPHAEAERMVVFALRSDLGELIEGHTKLWDELWQGDIIIEGAPEDQRDVRLALYNLYSFAREGTALSIAPMGLSTTTGYNGHVFWDTEIWMFPPLAMLNEGIARSLIDYRSERLGKATQRAALFGYDGAMFPWESDDSGEEATPTWCLTGTFEHHITADIGIAFWNYYRASGDKQWLKEDGYEVMKNVADFWASRASKNSDGSYSIINVVGANEFAHNVNDNAFTNGSAILAMEYAARAAEVLGVAPNPKWREISTKIKFHKDPSGVTMEHSAYRGEIIKQADVNLLAYPLELITDPEQILRDLKYYEPKMFEDGPAMGSSILSILYARLGDKEKAYELFKKSYIPNKRPPFGVLSESAFSNNPYFATGAGGMLQAVLNGFAGLRFTDGGITQGKTLLPSQWKSLTITGVGKEKKNYRITK